ncbi:MAG TPA: hypothetical protein ENN66_06410 [Proteobacteria bacterium]|nr:hypothetical protein [Pseudomonadota bacterium]
MKDLSWVGNLIKRREFLLALAAVLFFLVIAKAGYGVYQARSRALDDELALKQLQYEKLARLVARQQEFVELDQALSGFYQQVKERHLVRGETATLTDVQFQNLLQTLARESAIDVRSTKVMPEIRKDGVRLLRLRLNCRAEIGAIKDFLIRINNDDKFIFLQAFEIKNISSREKRFYYFNAEITALTV